MLDIWTIMVTVAATIAYVTMLIHAYHSAMRLLEEDVEHNMQ
jgi:hypothetical protein